MVLVYFYKPPNLKTRQLRIRLCNLHRTWLFRSLRGMVVMAWGGGKVGDLAFLVLRGIGSPFIGATFWHPG